MSLSKLPIAVLASGRGSNLEAIIKEIQEGRLSAQIKLVLSDNPKANALLLAKQAGIPQVAVARSDFPSRKEFERDLLRELEAAQVELVVLAGFMRLLSEDFVAAFPNRIMNIHPALLPSFPGLDGAKQAVEYGVRVSGCTVHFVDGGMDTGPIILQGAVPVLPRDTAEDLAARIQKVEHELYPEAISLFAQGRLKIEGRRVLIEECGK